MRTFGEWVKATRGATAIAAGVLVLAALPGIDESALAQGDGQSVSLASGQEVGGDTSRGSMRAARLTYTEGYVHVGHGDKTAGDPAMLNMPLGEGQAIVTGDNGQAEVEFEDGSVARVTPNSTLRLARLSVDGAGNYTTQVSLVKGLAYFELRAAPRFSYRVEAAGDVISPSENTTVRVNLDEAPAAVAVLDGSAHVERDGGYKVDVRAGETFRSDISGVGRYFLTQEIAGDTWDQWNEARDQAAADSAQKQTTVRDGFAGNQGYGWSDLDANGSWYNVPGQGQVWQPTGGDDAGFDPYDNGAWVWDQGAGYLWASNYSWGWTPFRCGGWSYWNTFGWGWAPNAGCGGFGFAGGYGGYGGYGYGSYGGLNIVLAPGHYPIHHRPGGGGPGVHPIIREGGGTVVAGGTHTLTLQGQRKINGVAVAPIRPAGTSYTFRGGSAVGASLRRDFPVDRTTHTPVLGTLATHTAGAAGDGGSGLRESGTIAGRPVGTGQQGFAGRPAEGGSGLRYGYQPGVRQYGTQPGIQQGLRPSGEPIIPAGGVQQGLRPSGQPIQSMQNYARPGVQQGSPHYSAPAPQMSHPSYSAPSAPAMHSAPSAPAASSGSHK